MLTSISYMDSTCRHCNKSGMAISTFCSLHFSWTEQKIVYTAIFCGFFYSPVHTHARCPRDNDWSLTHPTHSSVGCVQMCAKFSDALFFMRWVAIRIIKKMYDQRKFFVGFFGEFLSISSFDEQFKRTIESISLWCSKINYGWSRIIANHSVKY